YPAAHHSRGVRLHDHNGQKRELRQHWQRALQVIVAKGPPRRPSAAPEIPASAATALVFHAVGRHDTWSNLLRFFSVSPSASLMRGYGHERKLITEVRRPSWVR